MDKYWNIPIPAPDLSAKPSFRRVSQVKFYNEYFPSGHKIFNSDWYKDISVYEEKDGEMVFKDTYQVNRVSVAIQKMAIDIILAHLFGNKTSLVDGSLQDNEALPIYKEYWQNKNIDTGLYEYGKSVLSLADGAILFYRDEEGLRWQILSMFTGDKFKMEYDKYGDPKKFYKYYDDKVDVYDKVYCTTYEVGTDKYIEKKPHGFKGIPVRYRKREEGAFWTPVQHNIDEMEKMLSRLSEDNRSKFKSLYHLKTNNPDEVRTERSGNVDMVITDSDGDFKMVSGASLSEQFKFEFETQLELIYNSLGIVFPKHKSSGDMPTGSMKMMFYPTERVVMSLIHEFETDIEAINKIVKQGFVSENPTFTEAITNSNIRASIRLFTPQDDATKAEALVKLKKENILSGETTSEEAPYAANNEERRKEKERARDMEEEIELERKRSDARII